MIFSLFVFVVDLFFFFGGEVICNVECFVDFFWWFVFDYVGDSFVINV